MYRGPGDRLSTVLMLGIGGTMLLADEHLSVDA
jgi:hypothetical protein